jgi:hypothetical protein
MRRLFYALGCFALAAAEPPIPSLATARRVPADRSTNTVPHYVAPRPATNAAPPSNLNTPYWVRYGTTNVFANETVTRIWVVHPLPQGPK